MLVRADGSRVGGVSGGCLEADVVAAVPLVLRSGQARVLRFDTTAPEDAVFGYGSGCPAVIDVLVEPLNTARADVYLDALAAARTTRQSCALLTVTAGPLFGQRAALHAGHWQGNLASTLSAETRSEVSRALTAQRGGQVPFVTAQGETQAFLEVLLPPLHLLVFGADEGTAVLSRFALELGWEVSVLDFRPALLDAARFPAGVRLIESHGDALPDLLVSDTRCAALVASRHYLYDVAAVRALLHAPPYLGVLGSQVRLERLLGEALGGQFHPMFPHAPAGLDLGARTPAEIALAVISDILASFAARPGGPLKLRERGDYATV